MQGELSDKVSHEIVSALLTRGVQRTNEYLGFSDQQINDSGMTRDKADIGTPNGYELYAVLLNQDVSRQVFEAVIGYTDHLGCSLVRNGLTTMPLPLDSEINYETISEKYGPSVPLIRDVVARMNVQASLPLIGRLEQGKMVPDVETLSKWKDMFDWNSKATDDCDLE